MEDTKITLYRDIIIENIGFDEYQKNGPNGLMVFEEGAYDFIKNLIAAPIKAIKNKIDKHYDRIEKIESTYRKSLEKMGVDSSELDMELKSIVRKNIKHFISGVRTDNDSQVTGGFLGIKKGLADSPVITAISNRLKNLDPDTYIPVIGIYSSVVILKLIITVVVSQFIGGIYEFNSSGDSQFIYRAAKCLSVMVIGPLLDQAGVFFSIKINKSGAYQAVANVANTTAAMTMMHAATPASSFVMVMNRILNVTAHAVSAKFTKNAEDLDNRWLHFYAFAGLFFQRGIELITMGGRYWQFPGQGF